MKKTILKLMCVCIVMIMVLGMAGCKSTPKDTGSFDDAVMDFDLNGGEGTVTDTSDTEDGDTSTDTSDVSSTNSNQSGGTSSTTSTVKPAIKDPDSLSLKELMANIPSSVKGKTITVLSWNPVKEVTGAEKVIANFERISGIKVQWDVVAYEEYNSHIANLVNSGKAPDLIRYRGPEIHRQYFCQDIKAATGYDFDGKIWDQRISEAYTVKGKVYGVNLKNTLINQPRVIEYRPSMIKKYKLEDPYALWKSGKWTWDKMLEMCKKFKQLNSSADPLRTTDHADLLWINGIDFVNFDGKTFKNNINSNEVFKQLQKMSELRATGITSSAMRQAKDFEQGNVLFMIDNSISLRRTNANLKTVKSEDDVTAVPLPKTGSDSYWISEMEAYGVPKGAKNADAVYYFLRYYLDASNYDEDSYFIDKQSLEVYKWCMSQKKFSYRMSPNLLDAIGQAGGSNAGLSDYIRKGGTVANLKKELDSLKPIYDNATKKANEALAKFK